MNTIKEEVFVYYKTPFQEASEIVYAISLRGKISFISQGLKKVNSKNKLNCEIGSYTKVELNTKSKMHKLLNASIIQHSFTNDYQAMLITQLICDLIKKLEFSDFEVLQFMKKLSGFHKLLYFLYYLCEENGIAFNTENCVRSASSNDLVAISIKDGGLISQQALQIEDRKLSKNQITNLRVIARVNEATLLKYLELEVDFQTCKVFLDLIYQHLGVKSKLQNYLEEEI